MSNAGSLITRAGGTITNTGGVLLNQSSGVLRNYGSLNNDLYGSLVSNAGTLENYGSLNNNFAGSRIRNTGTLNNNGVLNNSASTSLTNTGTLTNAGTLTQGGTFTNTGTLTNTGTINVQTGSRMSGAGTFSQTAGVTTVDGAMSQRSINILGGSLTNSAMLTSTDTLTVRSELTNSGTISNSGTLDSYGTFSGSGLLNNTGTLTANELGISGPYGTVYQAGNVNITNSGNLSGNTLSGGSWVVNGGTAGASLSFGNSITPISTLTSGTSVTLNGVGAQFSQINGLISNAGSLNLSGGRSFDLVSGFSNSGTLSSSGRNTAPNILAGRTLNNSGTIAISDSGTLNNSSYGSLGNQAGGTFRNYGTINSASGYYFPSFNAGTLTNYATFNNSGYLANNGTVTNTGSFNVNAFGNMSGSGSFIQTAGITRVDGRMSQAAIGISGGLLSGNGTVTSSGVPVSIGPTASINPGGSVVENPGNFTGNLGFASAVDIEGSIIIELAGLLDFDTLTVLDNIDFKPGSRIRFDLDGWQPSSGDSLDFLFADTLTGFGGINYSFSGLDAGLDFDVLLTPAADLRLTFASAVPIPASLWLFGSGLLGVTGIEKRKAA